MPLPCGFVALIVLEGQHPVLHLYASLALFVPGALLAFRVIGIPAGVEVARRIDAPSFSERPDGADELLHIIEGASGLEWP